MPHNLRDSAHRRVPNILPTGYLQSFAAPPAHAVEKQMTGFGMTAYSTAFRSNNQTVCLPKPTSVSISENTQIHEISPHFDGIDRVSRSLLLPISKL